MRHNDVYIEITHDTLLVAGNGTDLGRVALARDASGKLTAECRQQISAALRARGDHGEARAFCAVSARGVLFRKLNLPAAGRDELARVALMQMETEFPIALEELLWGWRETGVTNPEGLREILVVAVKKELIADYDEAIRLAGLTPTITISALARATLCPSAQNFSVLDVGDTQSELLVIKAGAPETIRTIGWGLAGFPQGDAINRELEKLRGLLPMKLLDKRLFLTGRLADLPGIAARLSQTLGIPCELISTGEAGVPTGLYGLRKSILERAGNDLLFLQTGAAETAAARSRPPQTNWLALACGLALACLFMRYAEMWTQRSRLNKKLAEINAFQARMPALEKELSFFEHIKTNQAPYLDILTVLANAAQPGLRVENLAMARRGDIQLRAAMQNAQQAVDFRAKLIESGFFANVGVEEQNPSPDGQKLVVRMSAQLKEPGQRRPALLPVTNAPSAVPAPPNAAVTNSAAGGKSTNQPAAIKTK